jgi:O-antigen ligase
MPAPAAGRTSERVVFLAFLAVPLAACPALWDQFTTVKWYALEALAAAWILAEVFPARSATLPSRPRGLRVLVPLLAALSVASALRMGLGAAVGPLVERLAFASLALCSYWLLRRGGKLLAPARAATALALATVTALGLAQALGRDPLAMLNASDGRGSTFGNANMAAQYVGLALLLLLAGPWPRRRARVAAEIAVMAAALGWLAVLGTRSVMLALGVTALAWAALAGGRSRRVVVAAAAVVAALGLAWWAGTWMLSPENRARKAASSEHRLAVWSDTLRMIADHPLGVGSGGFEDVFRSYQATGATFADERIVFRQPHNEPLRITAEEGVPFVVVLLAAVGVLARACWPVLRADPGRPTVRLVLAWSVFLAVEGFFQFPFAMAFGVLATAVLVGAAVFLAAGGTVASDRPAARWPWRAAGALAAAALLAGGARLALSESLFVARRSELAAQEAACRLDPRNLAACTMGAWLRSAQGDLAGGRAAAAKVLRRAPHYPPAIKLIAEQALAAGDRDAACVYLYAYDQLFRGQSTMAPELARSCPAALREQAARRVPSPHYRRFPLAGADAR